MLAPDPAVQAARPLRPLPALRFLTCGPLNGGKSTLIGRLLYEENFLSKNQTAADRAAGAEIDFALLLDGPKAEREQGIMTDITCRSFATARRAFIAVDTPGHEQYARSMVAGASNCELAVLLVNARKGLTAQARHYAIIASLLGIRYVVLAVNKIDLVDYAREVFETIAGEFSAFAAELSLKEWKAIPLSAQHGDNISGRSARTPWYKGPHLLEYLETLVLEDERAKRPFRLPVQRVNRANLDSRGFAGTIATGTVCIGDEIAALPSGQVSRVKSIVGAEGEMPRAEAGNTVTLTLAEEIDAAPGDVLAPARERPQVADQFTAHIVWMSAERLLPGRPYLLNINGTKLTATITELKHRIDIDSLVKLAAKTLALNEVGVCNFSTSRPIAFDAFAENRTTGSFTLIDRTSNETIAAGIIDFALRRATNIHHQAITVSKADRTGLMKHRPAVLWFTGLSGAGKSTIANLVEAGLHARGVHTLMLDGDNVRHGLNKDLGFTEADRVENIRRIGEVAKLMTEAGLVVLCSFISPFRAERQMVRELMAEDEFIEIFVDTPIEQCIARDPKGLYRRALAGEIKNFTGVDQAYETPEEPKLHLMAGESSAAALAEQVIEYLASRELYQSDYSVRALFG
ncbi:MAG TPA: adenylyl-sulfate kinase [Pseudolabrys sp.]|jgi:bifunctional enzyme CysN/CysC|nr:adenylyl-sulfate kinase [Pseudolabrys sp.]